MTIRLVAVAAMAALLVLMSYRPARSSELSEFSAVSETIAVDRHALEMLETLAPRALPDRSERVERARELISEANQQRISRLGSSVAKTAWSLTGGVSPRRLLSGLRRVVQSVSAWDDWSEEEMRALILLKREVEVGAADPELLSLYEGLIERWESEGESALERGYAEVLEQTGLERLRNMLEPGDVPTLDLERRGPPLGDWRLADGYTPSADSPAFEANDVQLAAYMLAGRYVRAERLPVRSRAARVAASAARYLAGDQEQALSELRAFASSEDAAGLIARRWLDGVLRSREVQFENAAWSHRVDHALHWIGGDSLEAQGSEVSRSSYSAWKDALDPLKLVLSVPARILRGREPDSLKVREASRDYLVHRPDGVHAQVAIDWLEQTQPGAIERLRASSWEDGRFVLPRARTSYPSLLPPPVVVSRALLEELDLRSELGPGPVLLRAHTPDSKSPSPDLAPESARRIIAILAAAVEDQKVEVHPSDRSTRSKRRASSPGLGTQLDALAGLRRLDAALARGSELFVDAWSPEDRDLMDVTYGGTFDFLEGELDAEQSLFSSVSGCPPSALCMDSHDAFTAALYAHSSSDAGFRVGARTRLQEASLSVEVVDLWPRISLVLPISRWLQLDRWFGVEAHIGVSPTGLSAAPSFEAPATKLGPPVF